MLSVGSLFSGIGGLELGLERAGVGRTAWQVEMDPFCRSVLARHWPTVERHVDVREVGAANLRRVDLICGGFPCQDVSSAGARRGLAGKRSGLWFEYRRIVDEIRPAWVVVENVTSGKKLWLPQVRADLEQLGYGVRAFGISAADVGAPHLRRRVFVVAHSGSEQLREQPGRSGGAGWAGASLAALAGEEGAPDGYAHGDRESALTVDGEVAGVRGVAGGAPPWAAPPEFRGVDDGVPRRLDRLRALGNAVVPQCAEAIGRMIVAFMREEIRHVA